MQPVILTVTNEMEQRSVKILLIHKIDGLLQIYLCPPLRTNQPVLIKGFYIERYYVDLSDDGIVCLFIVALPTLG